MYVAIREDVAGDQIPAAIKSLVVNIVDRNICLYTRFYNSDGGMRVKDRTICLQKPRIFSLLPRGGT